MRRVSAFSWVVFFVLLGGMRLCAEPVRLSNSPRELGAAVLRELSIREGAISFRVDSNGCTDAASFRYRTERHDGMGPKTPHYLLTIERVRVDECKAMLWEGVVIEVDLEEVVGLSGSYTISVVNPVLSKGGLVP